MKELPEMDTSELAMFTLIAALNTIDSLIKKGESEKARELAETLRESLRKAMEG